jgi:hypothetical protein
VGLFEKLFKPKAAASAAEVNTYFKTLNAYMPTFTSRAGGIYEMELTRAAIHAFASHVSKLKPEVSGSASKTLKSVLAYQPNPFMDTTKFLYRLATVLEVDTTAFIVPLTDPTDSLITGFYPLLPSRTEVVEFQGEPWLRYQFANGQRAAIELARVGILTKHQYRDDLFGEGNRALSPTLDVLDVQRQGMTESVKNSAVIRFLARLGQTLRPEDITKERDRFAAENLSSDNTSGVMMVDAKYSDIKQLENKPYVIEAEQMKLIKDNVFSYFGVNEAILQNSYDENGWNAYYEGKIEPFALQLGLVLTAMVFSERERAFGNEVMFSSNRLQYASNASKLQVVRDLTDRGLMSDRMACDVFTLPYPTDAEGNTLPERYVIRGEYIDVGNLPSHTVDQAKSYPQTLPDGTTVSGVAADATDPAGAAVAPVDNLAATALNGAQIAALVAVVTAFKAEELDLGQAANIVAVALAISVDEAKKIVEGTL